jgi:hypothetical protein
MLARAPAPTPDDDPFAVFSGLGPQLGLMLVLAAVAIAVVWYARRQSRASARRRDRPRARPRWADAQWRTIVEGLRAAPPTPIAAATKGPVRIVAVLRSAPEHLGGASGRECVWRNHAGASADTAIAADMVFAADDSGRCAIENLAGCRVIGPSEAASRDRKSVALYLGDRVELIGVFAPERAGSDPDPRNLVYGTVGVDGPLEVRVDERPAPAADAPPAEANLPITTEQREP